MIIFVDIDNTVFDTFERQYQVLKEYLENHKNIIIDCYDECLVDGNFNKLFSLDENVKAIHRSFRKSNAYYTDANLIKNGLSVLSKLENVSFLSGRSVNSKKATIEQLSSAGFPTNSVILRPKNVHHSNISEWKLEYLLTVISQTDDLIYMIDDDSHLLKLTSKINNKNLNPILFKRKSNDCINAKDWAEISQILNAIQFD